MKQYSVLLQRESGVSTNGHSQATKRINVFASDNTDAKMVAESSNDGYKAIGAKQL